MTSLHKHVLPVQTFQLGFNFCVFIVPMLVLHLFIAPRKIWLFMPYTSNVFNMHYVQDANHVIYLQYNVHVVLKIRATS